MHATIYSHTSIKMQQIKMDSIYRTFAAVKIKLPFTYHFSIRLFSLSIWKLTVELLFFYIPWIKHPPPCPPWLKIILGCSSIQHWTRTPTNTVFLHQLFTKLYIRNPKHAQPEMSVAGEAARAHTTTWMRVRDPMRDWRPSDVLPVAPPGNF